LVELLAVGCTLLMSTGQVLLKVGLTRVDSVLTEGSSFFDTVLASIKSPHIVSGALLYLVAALAWVWILSQRPLSTIYPYLALTYAFALIGSALFLGEKVGVWQWAGVIVISVGIYLVSRT